MDDIKNAVVGLFVFFIIAQMFGSGCQDRSGRETDTSPRTTQEVYTHAKEAAKGLDLQAVSALAVEAKDAKTFEEQLNKYETGVNNLDLNEDGKVDFIAVTEFGSGKQKGFSLTTHPSEGEEVELATIHFNQTSNGVEVETQGNQHFYPHHGYYRSHFGLTDALLFAYIFSDHGHYRGGWRYGYYPSSYGRGWRNRTYSEYKTSQYNRIPSSSKSVFTSSDKSSTTPKAVSPNRAKTITRAKSLTTPKSSQKSFSSSSSKSKSSSWGGFGRTSSSSSGSRSSFGGGK